MHCLSFSLFFIDHCLFIHLIIIHLFIHYLSLISLFIHWFIFVISVAVVMLLDWCNSFTQSHIFGLPLDCYTVPAHWLWNCQWVMAGFKLVWLTVLKYRLRKASSAEHCGFMCDLWEFPLFFEGHWQSPCTALMAGKCLPLGLCKGTVKESRLLHWHWGNCIIAPVTVRIYPNDKLKLTCTKLQQWAESLECIKWYRF